jgi:porphobilinogen synthase
MITGKYPNLRLRRTRKYTWSRRLIQENNLSSNDFIYPIFLIEGKNKKQPIKSMPDIYRYTIDKLGSLVSNAIKNKIPMVALFPSTPKKKKDYFGSEALNENNLVCRATRYIKKRFKNDIGIMCDVALDPYTSHGHDGLLKDNYVLNDKTIEILKKQSLIQAEMGCDVIAPSDMMDGRIGKIRKFLDKNNHHDVQLLSYAVKFASNFYGPFRDAIGSKKSLISDKKNYQMDYANSDESIREVALDIKEGADIIMVKPGMPYLDVIRNIKDKFRIPVLAYQVSGEYSLIKNGIKNKLIKEDAIMESLISFKRAGASAIVTYFAIDIARKLKI